MSLTAAGVENKRENLLPNILESVYIYIYHTKNTNYQFLKNTCITICRTQNQWDFYKKIIGISIKKNIRNFKMFFARFEKFFQILQ